MLLPILSVVVCLDLAQRCKNAQDLLLQDGPSNSVLQEYNLLAQILSKSHEELPQKTAAQVFYNKALVELSMNRIGQAANDLQKTLEIDSLMVPARARLQQILIERGDFDRFFSIFTKPDDPQTAETVESWLDGFRHVEATLSSKNTGKYEESLKLLEDLLIPVAPSNSTLYEMHIQLLRATQLDARKMTDSYGKLLKLAPQKNLQWYSEYLGLLLFTQLKFSESWNAAKACLRIDNDQKLCAVLSKTYSRLQMILRNVEDYSVLNGFLYSSEDTSIDDERLSEFKFDWGKINLFLQTDPVKSPASEKLLAKTNMDLLLAKASEFSTTFYGKSVDLAFVDDLVRLLCEAAVHAGYSGQKKVCGAVDEKNGLFFPKHMRHVDHLLAQRKFPEAKGYLERFGPNVKKSPDFKIRWNEIDKRERLHREQQQRQRQQQFFHQQQRQQQQQQKPQGDASKDYYKILDIPKDADEKTIRKAYKMQTLKYHPDKYKGKDLDEKGIEHKMQEINEAYEILSDPEARAQYDSPNQGQNVHFGQNVQFHPEQFMAQFMGGNGFNFGGGNFKFTNNNFQKPKGKKKRRRA